MDVRSILIAQLATAMLLTLTSFGSAQQSAKPRAGLASYVEPPTIQTQRQDDVLPDLEEGKAKPTILGTPEILFTSDQPFRGRLINRVDIGDGVGYTRGFNTLEAMLPLTQTHDSLFFTDLRVVNFFTTDRWEYNAGLGYRWYSPLCNKVLGVNSFYDGRRTDFHYWQQLGIGFEVLSPGIEWRVNGYFVVGPQSRQNGDPVFVNLGVINNNQVTQRRQLVEHALSGLDTELGGRLPFLDRFAPRAYIGYYTYSSEAIASTHGIRGRLEAQLTRNATLHFAIQRDRLFETTVSGGITFYFGAPAYRTAPSGRASWNDVLHQRLQRDINIVISPTTDTSNQNTPISSSTTPPPSSKD